jgi:subtilase family serine protease/subtilisin family serine protease
VLESWKTALVEAGAEIGDYVPQFSFRVRMTPPVAARVRRLGFVSAVNAVRVDQKLAPRLRRNGAMPYIIRLERGAMPAEVETALGLAGVQVLRRGSQLLIVADSSQIDRLANIDGVATIENFVPRIKHNEFGGGVIMGSTAANASGFDGSTQTIGIADTGLGLGTAAGARADIAPSRVTSIFNWPGVPDFCFETISNDGAQDVDTGHGTHVATAALGAGNASGAGRGTAPAANLVFQALENYAVPSMICSLIYGLPEGYYLVGLPSDIGQLFNQAYQQNARVHSDSWGAEVAGDYTADSANADAFIWSHRDLAVTFSAGNSGTDADFDGVVDGMSINAPGTAKNVITVGASENDRQSHWECDPSLTYTTCAAQGGQNDIFTYGSAWPDRYPMNPLKDDPSAGNAEQMAAFSSRGPTSDGRIKPDVVAPGTWNLSGYSALYQEQYDAQPNPLTGTYQYDGWGFPANASYKYMGGTSMAAPLVAGGAAVVRDFYVKSRGHQASAALVKAVLINSAVDLLDENNDGVLDNANPIPNMHEGWGRVDLVNATDASDAYFDEATPLSTGTSTSQAFEVTSPGVPLKVTLAWTDYPAATSSVTQLVNDLDLTVTAPDGTVYKGNVFSGGWSAPGGTADRLNNVENVYVFSSAVGTWTIDVSGYNVPNGPQPFALVIDTMQSPSGLPMVRVTVDDGTATEAGPTSGLVRFTRSGDTASALEVAYTVAGTAVSGSDYSALSGFITIPEGEVDATLEIAALDDPIYENSESVIVTAVATAAYVNGSPSSGVVTIASDDLPPDLAMTNVTAPAVGAAGTTISVSFTTKNQGTGPAPSTQTALYLSVNSTWEAGDPYLAERAVPALGPGVSDVASLSVEIPGGTPNGTYHIVARADWPNAVDESNETNNVRASTNLKIGPDLIVYALTAPLTANAGDPIVVSDTTKNQGGTPTPSTTTAFYLSTNATLDASDVPLGSRAVNPLNYNVTHGAQTTLTIPASTALGTYYVLAQADSGSVVAELVETNNLKASAAMKVGSDLSVTVLTSTSYVGAGDVVNFNDTTANLGATDAPESTTRFYFSVNSTLDASDPLVASRTVPPLDAGGTSAGTVQVTIPASTTTGVYYVFANADADHEIAETSETNNSKRFTINVGPDLTIVDVDPPMTAEAGGPLNVVEITNNIGGGVAPSTQTSFYLSTNATWEAGDVYLGVRTVPSLTAGQSSTVTTPLTVPAGTASGSYYVIAKADHTSSIVELLETNNVRASGLFKIGPDLSVSILNAASTVVRGTPFTISDTTRNDGSAVGSTTTSYYLSVNNTLDAGDLLLGSRTVGALASATSENGQVSVVIPATQATGNYYIIAKADNANVAVESNENNNVRTKTIKVNP